MFTHRSLQSCTATLLSKKNLSNYQGSETCFVKVNEKKKNTKRKTGRKSKNCFGSTCLIVSGKIDLTCTFSNCRTAQLLAQVAFCVSSASNQTRMTYFLIQSKCCELSAKHPDRQGVDKQLRSFPRFFFVKSWKVLLDNYNHRPYTILNYEPLSACLTRLFTSIQRLNVRISSNFM